MLTRLYLLIVFYFPRFKRFFWRPVYNFMARRFPHDFWQFMNYGYMPNPGSEEMPPLLSPEFELQRYPLQMYHFLALKGPIEGKDVLEVGSGRGGGANYLYKHQHPASYTGIDYAEDAVNLSNTLHKGDNLRFVQGDAQDIPFSDAQFDIVINVESSFLYSNFPRFLHEVKRVLRPGGKLLLVDFRLNPHFKSFEEGILGSGLTLLSVEDISQNVLASLTQLDKLYKDSINTNIPRLIRGIYKEFAALKGSEFFTGLEKGDRRYFRYVLQKP